MAAPAPSLNITPLEAHNLKLTSNVHPPGWVNPEPAPRYNLVVLGAGTGGYTAAFRAAQLGLKTAAGHFGHDLFKSNLSQVTDAANTLGMSYTVLSSVPESYRHSIDGYKRAAEFFNQTCEGCRKAGVHFGYPNHNRDFEKFGNTIALDLMLKSTDPALVTFEMDCFWVTRAGYDPVAYMNKYPGRFQVLHVKDERKHYPPTVSGRTPGEAFAPVGKGIIDWKRIFKAAPRGGLKYYFVEQDQTELPVFDAIKISYDYLHNLRV